MIKKLFIVLLVCCQSFFLHETFCDTFYLSTGVTFDGKIIEETQDGIITVKVGNQLLKYKKDEILRIEKNDKTGEINIEQLQKEWEKKDKILTEKTGLNKDQRAQVEALISTLEWGEEFQKTTAKNSLIQLQKTMNIFPYLEYQLSSLSPSTGAIILEVMLKIDKNKTIPILRRELINPAPEIRKKAIELLAVVRDTESFPELIRGLVDPELDVCLATIYMIGLLKYKEVTPVLIEYLKHPQLEIQNASREVLNKLWADELSGSVLQTHDEWQKFWDSRKSTYPNAIKKEQLTPLVDKDFRFFIG